MNRYVRSFVFVALGCFSLTVLGAEVPASPNIADQIRFPVKKVILKNGLTLLMHEDHSAPIISFHQWFRVGSLNERVGRTGLAHFFEHLMFKGTKKYPGKEFERLIQRNGGSNNAFTSRDYTGYYTNLPSDKLELIIDVEVDRLVNLNFDPKVISSEREVVKEERRMRVENNVTGSLFVALFRSMYKVHNYRWPVIGSMRDLNAASIDDMKKFYRGFYSPNNSVIVISGDFDTDVAEKLVRQRYGPIKKQKVPETLVQAEPEQKSPRRKIIKKDVQSGTFAIAYPGPALGEDDTFALDLVASILGQGSSSRLHKRMVYKEQRATSVSAFNYTLKQPGLVTILTSLKPGKGIARAKRSILAEVKKIREKGVSESELEKAKNQVMLGYVQSLKTISGKAHALALNEIYFRDYEQVFKDLDKYNSLTVEDLNRAAKKYLVPQRQNSIEIVPKKS